VEENGQTKVNDFVPGKLINFIGAKSKSLKVECKVNNILVTAIIDTGSNISFINSKFLEQHQLAMSDKENLEFTAIGDDLSTIGTFHGSVNVGGVNFANTTFSVIPERINSNILVLFGVDFFKNNDLELCIRDRKIIKHCSDKGLVEINFDETGKIQSKVCHNIVCYAAANVQLSCSSAELIPVYLKDDCVEPDELVVYTGISAHPNLQDLSAVSGIFDINNKRVLLITSDTDTNIKMGTPIGSISSVLDMTENEDSVSCKAWTAAELHDGVSLSHLDAAQSEQVYAMMENCLHVFSVSDSDVGHASVTQHKIKLTDDTPIYQRPRRFPGPVADEIERQCQELNSLDIIEPSISPWSAPVVPIRKKDGTIRLCIDYRQLNKVTVPDKFPMPNLTDSIFGLKGTKFFTSIDLVRGYYQIPIDEQSRQLTAFSTPRNHWQFKRLSFGLTNAPAAFQREIQAVLSSFPSNKVIAYIDDILIMSSDFEEHLSLVHKVLQTLQNYNIKIKPTKCDWFVSQVRFLGHIVSQSGIKKTPEYVQKVSEYPRPKTVGELREFLGLINFQRKFLPGCSEIQKPLSCLTGGKRNRVLSWSSEMSESFNKLIYEMQQDVELAYPDYDEDANKLELWVDASAYGAGAYLAQEQGEHHRVIGFASMTFTDTQLNYSTLERELTALRWGIKTFKPFLYGIEFNLYTDHQPLVHLHNMRLVSSRLARTMEELSDFSFHILYTPGHLNSAADALSRLKSQVPRTEVGDQCPIPDGLVIEGQPAPGGGDSLFISLMRVLKKVSNVTIPDTHEQLRQLLVDELVAHPQRYKLKLDKTLRKEFKLMRCRGQLPALELLLSASRLYEVRIFVYFWIEQPVIYQFDDYDSVVHLQCVSGIHFNPLSELKNYVATNTNCNVVDVNTSVSKNCRQDGVADVDDTSELDEELTHLLLIDDVDVCEHKPSSQPQVFITINNRTFCAVLDTGADINLVSHDVINTLQPDFDIEILNEEQCSISGFSGITVPITQTLRLKFKIGSCNIDVPQSFGIVRTGILPYCFLLGRDFLTDHNIDIDFQNGICKQDQSKIAYLNSCNLVEYVKNNILVVSSEQSAVSHELTLHNASDGFRFEIQGSGDTFTRMSMLLSDDTIRDFQSRDSDLRQLKRVVSSGVSPKEWPDQIQHFTHHASKLNVRNNILTFTNSCEIIVLTFKLTVELILFLHYNFAHVGRDKILNMLFDLVWHPSKYKIANDVCTTCHMCQLSKVSSTIVGPPTLKISSSYPFELVAADLLSLPKTSSGYIGCLVVVDHYTKWLAVVPIRNKKSVTITQAFQNQILPFLPCVPSKLLTDNGPEFISNYFSDYLKSMDIHHQLTTPYHPTSNGAVERVNRTIQGFLRSLGESNNWDQNLSKAVIVYNNTSHSELKMSPSSFILSKNHQSDDTIPLKLSGVTQKWKIGHPKFLPFKVGQLVLRKVQTVGNLNVNKFANKYDGPLTVAKTNDNGVTYQLVSASNGSTIRAHHSDLHLYKRPPSYVLKHPCYEELTKNIHINKSINVDYSVTKVNVAESRYSTSDTTDGDGSNDDASTGTDSDVSFKLPETVFKFPSFNENSISSVDVTTYYKNELQFATCLGCAYEHRREVYCLVNQLNKQTLVTTLQVEPDEHFDISNGNPEFWELSNICNADDVSACYEGSSTVMDPSKLSAEAEPNEGDSCFDSDQSVSELEQFIDRECSNLELLKSRNSDPRIVERRNKLLLGSSHETAQEVPTQNVESSTPNYTRQTRSKGPVPDFPHVQPKILERLKSCKGYHSN
jgi:hypothetical protein